MIKLYCSNCGNLINGQSNFCRICGAPQKGKESASYRVEQPPIGIGYPGTAQNTQNANLESNFKPLDRQQLGKMAIVYFLLQNIRYSGLIIILLIVGSVFNWVVFVPFIVLYFLILYVISKLKYRYFRYSLTDSFLLIEWGIITKKQVSIPYVQIENINIKRGITDLMLGLAQISIETAGSEEASAKGTNKYFAEGDIPAISFSTAKNLHDVLLEQAKNFQQNS